MTDEAKEDLAREAIREIKRGIIMARASVESLGCRIYIPNSVTILFPDADTRRYWIIEE